MTNKYARPANFGHLIRNPLLREHFVYRAFNADGALLYVGCTYRLDSRLAAHRATSKEWSDHAVKVKVSGPYNYETARDLERQAIHTERPLHNYTPERRKWAKAQARVIDRHMEFLMARGEDWDSAIRTALDVAHRVIGYPGNRGPCLITDLTIPSVLRAEAADARRLQERAA